jgi:2-polyprenyl-3-methyl-5-hydroxy-6-metoxy-1,4-benzoquinol methylase
VSSSPSYLDPIVVPLIKGKTVLDVACGYGRWGSLIRSNFFEAGLPEPPLVDGIDAFLPNVEYCARQSCYRRVWQQALPSPLPSTWDTVLACEILEHIPQERVEETLAILENAAVQRIIISTPNFENLRGGGDTFLGYNDFEAHLSHTPRSFFAARGYRLVGAGFGNPESRVAWLLRKAKRLRPAYEGLPRLFPSLGISLVAYKDK